MKIRQGFGLGVGACFFSAVVLSACAGDDKNLGGKDRVEGTGGSGAGGAVDRDSGAGGDQPSAGGSVGNDSDGSVSTGGTVGNGGTGVGGGGGGTEIPNKTGGLAKSKKLDLLLVVDNSISMADKQKVLSETVPDLVNRVTAADSGVDDLHVGVITSSLGDHGVHSTCQGVDGDAAHPWYEQLDDHAHLVTTRPRGTATGLPHVISWTRSGDVSSFTTQVQTAVSAVGEFGCGLEAQLEAVYRFLVDPAPPASIEQQPCPGTTAAQHVPCAVPTGRDDALLAQRAEFLRPDSAVGVVLLTDENDCSIRDTQQYFYAARTDVVLPKASSACENNPNDPCCYNCAGALPAGCTADPACSPPTGNPAADAINLRCFDQKQRFGLDFLYPVARYVNALSRTSLCTARTDLLATDTCPAGELVDNPLFVNGTSVRDPSMVYFLGIVGVPWQDLAGSSSTATSLAYKTPAQLGSDGTWNVVLGDPAASPPVRPTDGLMVESIQPRALNDATGAPIPGPNATLAENNAINGHDWGNADADDLQYACTFRLAQPRNCTDAEAQVPAAGCDCGSSVAPGDDNPLCQDPSTGTYGVSQYSAKAYPSLRELSVVKSLGTQAFAASVCARNLTNSAQADYGYRPAVDLLLGGMANSLK